MSLLRHFLAGLSRRRPLLDPRLVREGFALDRFVQRPGFHRKLRVSLVLMWYCQCCMHVHSSLDNVQVAIDLFSFVFVATPPSPSGPGPPHSRGFYITHNDAPQSVGLLWTPLGEWTALHRDLYLTTYNTYNRQTSMLPVGFEPNNLSRRAPAGLRLRPRGHWDRLSNW